MVALTGAISSLAVKEVTMISGVETGLESSMLCLLRRQVKIYEWGCRIVTRSQVRRLGVTQEV